ncbi:hypothetical protein P3S67_028528 [Capsicum chacoense]
MRLLGAFISMAKMVFDSSEAVSVVSKDLKEFLQSDSDELPRSLKQLSKIARSEEFTNFVVRVSQDLTVGILRGYGSENKSKIEEVSGSSFINKVMDRMMSTVWTGFVSVVVGSFARNLVMGFYSNSGSDEGLNGNHQSGVPYIKANSSEVPRWVDVVSTDRCKQMVADYIQTFNQVNVKDFLVSVCNGVIETPVKASHQVMTTSGSDSDLSLNSSCSIVDQSDYLTQASDKALQQVPPRKINMSQPIDLQSNRWLSSVSSTFVVPSYRRFVLDVTGRVTFETVRSIVEFFTLKISENM